ncbi:protein Son-like isoform X3 [Atheta coriaria]|uniref:protein Son-like isoform X3 n=1 Tax=Dalotia coriaria TaxID=877792 RepID=UPI0031F3AEDB
MSSSDTINIVKNTNEPEDAELKDEKPQIEAKSSMQILSELFSTFDAEPPVIVKKEKDDDVKKHKKSKKKHKHKNKKDKKHKKKSKKKRRKSDNSSSSDTDGIDLSDIIKTEITQTSLLSDTLQTLIKSEIKQEVKEEPGEADNSQDKSSGNSNINSENTDKKVDTNKSEVKNGKSKITIKEIKASSLLNNGTEHKKSHKRKKHEHHDKHDGISSKRSRLSKSRSRSNSRDRIEKRRKDRKEGDKYHRSRSPRSKLDDKYDRHEKYRDETSHRSDKYKSDDKYEDRDYREHKSNHDSHKERGDYRQDKYRDDHRHKSDSRRHDSRDDDFYKNYNEDRRFKDRFKDRERISRSDENETRFDKKKLLEIARKNAIQMMKSGKLSGAMNLGPQAQEKVIAAISGGGKTVEELTDFCKTLSKKEELGELSSVSSQDESESEEEDMTIRHPFQIKEKQFTINIKNSVPLPTRTNQERASELRIQFPVSSGQHHRKTESEWVPVSPKKTDLPTKAPTPAVTAPVAIAAVAAPLPIEAAPIPQLEVHTPSLQNMQVQVLPTPGVQITPGPQVFPPACRPSEQEIASIVSQRLAAMRKLQENPNDSQAIIDMYNAQKGMNTWAESKLPFGQFTGTTGANILSQEQLASGYQAWARKTCGRQSSGQRKVLEIGGRARRTRLIII